MKLKQLVGSFFDLDEADGSLKVSAIVSASGDVHPGSVFFGLPGANLDGAKFLEAACEAGAIAAVVSDTSEISAVPIPVFRHCDPRHVLAIAAARFFGSQPAIVGAVTGTSGKTSVATFLRQIWTREGKSAASIGTTGIVAPGREDDANLTTPDPVSLHRLLSELHHHGVTHAALEASSHGLDQSRLDGVNLSVAGFTNLGRDHLDYHRDIDSYLDAKLILFRECLPVGAPAVIFADDPFSKRVMDAANRADKKVLTVGRKGDFIVLKKVEYRQFDQVLELEHDETFFTVKLPLAGGFQVSNALVAAGMAIACGTAPRTAFRALEKLQGASGRLELVGRAKTGAPVYVDYAHKPEALEQVLRSLRPFTSGKIVLVFGCGGDRDRGKRALMGEIAYRLADTVIVTDDNPRTERADQIRSQILAACPSAVEIGDRETAIGHACELLENGDSLVIAGKGHENGQIVGGDVLPFSDHEVARKALEKRSA